MLMWVQNSVKKSCVQHKDYIWNSSTCTCENGKYLESVIEDE